MPAALGAGGGFGATLLSSGLSPGEKDVSKALYSGRRVHWMPLEVAWRQPTSAVTHCCASMVKALEFDCDQHSDPFACADALIVYNEVRHCGDIEFSWFFGRAVSHLVSLFCIRSAHFSPTNLRAHRKSTTPAQRPELWE